MIFIFYFLFFFVFLHIIKQLFYKKNMAQAKFHVHYYSKVWVGKVSYAPQSCIYLIKKHSKTVIL